jgi:hypothetical protein
MWLWQTGKGIFSETSSTWRISLHDYFRIHCNLIQSNLQKTLQYVSLKTLKNDENWNWCFWGGLLKFLVWVGLYQITINSEIILKTCSLSQASLCFTTFDSVSAAPTPLNRGFILKIYVISALFSAYLRSNINMD